MTSGILLSGYPDDFPFKPPKRVCEWPECDERQAGLMRFCEHHSHRILMGHDEPPEGGRR